MNTLTYNDLLTYNAHRLTYNAHWLTYIRKKASLNQVKALGSARVCHATSGVSAAVATKSAGFQDSKIPGDHSQVIIAR